MRKLFKDLTVQDSDKKQAALKELLATLDFSHSGVIASVGDLELLNEDLKYSVKRLVRGLASGRDDARMGFSLALTEVLKKIKIKVGVLWDLIISLTEAKGSSNSKEERDISIGRIFGVMAMVNSGMIKNTGIELQEFKEIVDFLIKSFHFKVYLRIPAMEVLLLLLEEIKQQEIGVEGISYSILKGIKTGKEVEEIWMIIRLQNSLQVEYDWQTLLQEEWGSGDPLDRQNLKKLVDILKDSTILNPDLHPIWEDIFMNLIPHTQQNNSKKRIKVLELWGLLEQTLFNSTHERKCMGFGLFNYLLKNVPQDEVVKIFGQNFTRCLMNSLSSKEAYLNKIAKRTADQISIKAEECKDVALDLLLQLIGPYGSLNFDSISKTKTVEKILNNLSPEQVVHYISYLKGLFIDQNGGHQNVVDTQKGPEVVRSRILDQFVSLFKIQGIEKNEAWIKEILKFLVCHGFFTAVNPSQETGTVKPPLSQKTQAYARAKLESVLGSLHSIIIHGYKERKYHGLMLNGEPWTRYVIDTMDEFKLDDTLSSLIEFDETVEHIFEKTGKLLKSIRKKKLSAAKDSQSEATKLINQLNSFESLISHVLIQSYSDPTDLTSLIDDFEACFVNLWRKESRSKKRKSQDSEEEANIVPIDVLVDIFLSLLSKPSAPLRALILDIFKVFSSLISEKSLEIIFEVLKSANGPAGSEDIFEEDDDVEEISGEIESVGDNSSETDDSDNVEIPEKEEVEEDDHGMDDDEMEAYDVKLAAIFKQRSLDQTQKKDMKKHTLHFKLRVIDLLEAFSQSQPQSPLILFLIENMLDLVMLNSGEKELKDRLTTALRKILSRKEHPSSVEIDTKKVEEMIRQFHNLSGRISDSSFSNLCSLASVFLVKVLSGSKQVEAPAAKKLKTSKQSSTTSDISAVSQIYLDSFNSFITKSKSKLKPSLFLELFNRYPQYGWDILDQMVELLGAEKIKSYNLVQGYNILATLIKLNKEISGRSDIIDTIAPKISNNLIRTLQSSVAIEKGPFQLNKERFRDLMKDLITLIRVSNKICSNHTLEWNNEQLLTSVNNFIEARNLSDAKWMKNLLKELQNLIKS